MPDSLPLVSSQAQALASQQSLARCNTLSLRYGLSLSPAQWEALQRDRQESLVRAGRVEFGEGVLPKLVYAFCDSPYIARDEYAAALSALQELFYQFKNELGHALSDEELVDAMARLFHHRAQGSLEYLENLTPAHLYRAAFTRGALDEEEEDALDDDFE